MKLELPDSQYGHILTLASPLNGPLTVWGPAAQCMVLQQGGTEVYIPGGDFTALESVTPVEGVSPVQLAAGSLLTPALVINSISGVGMPTNATALQGGVSYEYLGAGKDFIQAESILAGDYSVISDAATYRATSPLRFMLSTRRLAVVAASPTFGAFRVNTISATPASTTKVYFV